MEDPMFQIHVESEKPGYGKFVIEPMVQGYGHTVGNALRRVLLSSLPGGAITSVKIAGVQHQFSTLKGIKEDVVEVILNLKKVRIKIEDDEHVVLKLKKKGVGPIVAGDIEAPAGVTIVNPDLLLGTIADKSASVEMEMKARKGFGFLPTEEGETTELGEILIDASFSPILRVNYTIEATRVGRVTDLDKLVLEIWTDGTIKPLEAVKQSAQILVKYFTQVFDPKVPEVEEEDGEDGEVSDEILKTRIEELDIPTRIVNALAKAGIETIEDVTKTKKNDLMKVKNLGTKSISIVKEQLQEKGVSFLEE